jgi:aspartate beta-hydroxylase
LLERVGKTDEAVIAYWQAWRQFPNPEQLVNDSIAPPNLWQLVAHAGEAIRDKQMELIEAQLKPIRERYAAQALSRVERAAEIYVGRLQPDYQHALQRPSYLYLPDIPPSAFFERSDFPWLTRLEAATDAIRAELQSILASEQGLAPYVQVDEGMDPMQWRELDRSPQWSSFHLMRGGVRNEENCARCPAALEALQSIPLAYIGEHAPEVFFSILKPGTHIPAHSGLGNYKLVTHLPLIIPGDCSIRVGNETRGWTEGQCLIFDDSFQHEAWNLSGSVRAVLILDIWNPRVTQAERDGMTALVEAIWTFNRKYRDIA